MFSVSFCIFSNNTGNDNQRTLMNTILCKNSSVVTVSQAVRAMSAAAVTATGQVVRRRRGKSLGLRYQARVTVGVRYTVSAGTGSRRRKTFDFSYAPL